MRVDVVGAVLGVVLGDEDGGALPEAAVRDDVDQRVSRMWKLFGDAPDLTPYDARQPSVTPFGAAGAPVNGASAPMAAASATWDFSRQDATPEIALNEAIWKSVRGRESKMPQPRHEHIIGSRPNDEDD